MTIQYHADHCQELISDNGTAPTSQQVQSIADEIAKFVDEQNFQEQIDERIRQFYREMTDQPQPDQKPKTPVTVHTDGSCLGNPGPGGWCAILNAPGQTEKILSGNEKHTTNNRMEMTAVIHALTTISDSRDVTIHTDSRYICDAFNKGWLVKWHSNGWKTAKGQVLNRELWVEMTKLVRGNGRRQCSFVWVKAHAGNPDNERADNIARLQASKV